MDTITIAVPKGRILKELHPVLSAVGIEPEVSFFDESSRQLQFATSVPEVNLIRVRSSDVATFVAFNAAQLGVCGSDILGEYDYPDIYAPLDLHIGICRLSVAEPVNIAEAYTPEQWSHTRIATKYPNTTRRYFARYGVQAECIKLNGAMELAPMLGLASRIVDLVSTGSTLKANGLREVESLCRVSARLIVNRTAFKTRNATLNTWVNAFREAVHAKAAA